MPVAVPTGQPQTPMSAAAQRKAREAAQERQALRPANPSDPYYASSAYVAGASSPGASQTSGPTSPTTAASGVMVHDDAGVYVPPDEGDEIADGPSELPPQ